MFTATGDIMEIMDEDSELLMHVAAGTDPLTALAALPGQEGENCDDFPQNPIHGRGTQAGHVLVNHSPG
jgi:hypothetical protein